MAAVATNHHGKVQVGAEVIEDYEENEPSKSCRMVLTIVASSCASSIAVQRPVLSDSATHRRETVQDMSVQSPESTEASVLTQATEGPFPPVTGSCNQQSMHLMKQHR